MSNVEFIGSDGGKHEYVLVNGVKHECLLNAKKRLSGCTNMKEYVEGMEYLAYKVFIGKTVKNDGFFSE
ncbi:hypothetical protein [Acetivibrio mesophilus]|uniref:Uncharacterized protein n=1 Tax=Acetivibrio mesophilus TaxID=2487273 RepID=A0A4V1K2L6_9FIRM|nr:hypothetical protein [Acetivibrio mesophilus]ODM26228.1 hypothetical protein A7W90_08320 [Clostridium sp. Bc-iso-3]RXE60719.1 hypothetical protein EFD62_02020 [Acetivibrio mesophilus]HHV28132.1 hypothetical protein [Clostridium sp.]